MTNLQVLLSVLELEEEKNTIAIVENFNKQEEFYFTIDASNYILLYKEQLHEKLYDQYEEDIYAFMEHCEDFRGFPYYRYIEESELIQSRADLLNADDLENHIYLGKSGDFYIFEVL